VANEPAKFAMLIGDVVAAVAGASGLYLGVWLLWPGGAARRGASGPGRWKSVRLPRRNHRLLWTGLAVALSMPGVSRASGRERVGVTIDREDPPVEPPWTEPTLGRPTGTLTGPSVSNAEGRNQAAAAPWSRPGSAAASAVTDPPVSEPDPDGRNHSPAPPWSEPNESPPPRFQAADREAAGAPRRTDGGGRGPERDAPYRVRPGDSLWDIAAHVLGTDDPVRIARYWPRIHRSNRDVIGPNPNLIYAGQLLRLPREVPR
jgi:hypothetical protein